MMESRPLGNSTLNVPAVGMGTYRTFDVTGTAGLEHCRRLCETAVSAGSRLFDSSPMYGEAEQVLAKAVADKRREVLIATKVWSSSAREGRRQIRQALEWYGGYVDIYQIHNLVAWKEHLPYLEELRADGKINVIGITHYSSFAFRELLQVMRTGRVQQIQIPYNVVDTDVEREILKLAAELAIGVLVMRPLEQGALARKSPPPGKLAPLKKYGINTWPQALLKWILSDRRVHCVIPATSRYERAMENAAAGTPPWFDAADRDYVKRLAAEL